MEARPRAGPGTRADPEESDERLRARTIRGRLGGSDRLPPPPERPDRGGATGPPELGHRLAPPLEGRERPLPHVSPGAADRRQDELPQRRAPDARRGSGAPVLGRRDRQGVDGDVVADRSAPDPHHGTARARGWIRQGDARAAPERARRGGRPDGRRPGELLARRVDADPSPGSPTHGRRPPDAAGAPDQERRRDRDHRRGVRDRRRGHATRDRLEPLGTSGERGGRRRDADPLLHGRGDGARDHSLRRVGRAHVRRRIGSARTRSSATATSASSTSARCGTATSPISAGR